MKEKVEDEEWNIRHCMMFMLVWYWLDEITNASFELMKRFTWMFQFLNEHVKSYHLQHTINTNLVHHVFSSKVATSPVSDRPTLCINNDKYIHNLTLVINSPHHTHTVAHITKILKIRCWLQYRQVLVPTASWHSTLTFTSSHADPTKYIDFNVHFQQHNLCILTHNNLLHSNIKWRMTSLHLYRMLHINQSRRGANEKIADFIARVQSQLQRLYLKRHWPR